MIPQKEELILSSLLSTRKTGAEIKSAIFDATGIDLLPGSLYPTLKKLSEDGLIRVESPNKKKIYKITKYGEMLINRETKRKETLKKI